MRRLDAVDLSLKLSRKEQDRLLALHAARLAQLRLTLGGLIGSGRLGPPLCVLFEGWDAGGKGGAIKRLVAPLDARHVRVKTFAAPTPDEKRHHYLHRFVAALPGWGGMADDGMIIVKLFLHISDAEQLKRFERRRQDPLKAWKLTDEDWRNREKRPAYEAAIEEMFERTDTEHAPWRIIPADSKRHARVQVMHEVIAAIEEGCERHDFALPEPLEQVADD